MASRIRAEDIYEALFDDAALARLPDIMAQAAGARSGLMFWQHRDGVTPTIAYNYLPAEMMQEYASEWSARDPWVVGAARSGRLNEIMLLEKYVSRDRYENSLFFNEFVRKHHDNSFHCTGVVMDSEWGRGIVSVQRGKTAAPFDDDDAARLRPVIVHVERVLRARGEIESARRAAAFAQGALDAVGLVAITVRANGRILHSNEPAEKILERADGLTLKAGALCCAAHLSQKQLSQAITAATDPHAPCASSVAVARNPGEPAYLITVTPLTSRAGESAALVLFRDPDMPDNSRHGRLRSLYNLTNAEAAVALDIASGLALSQIASNRAVKIVTLRSQLKSIGAKTGCSRQTEIAALVNRLSPN